LNWIKALRLCGACLLLMWASLSVGRRMPSKCHQNAILFAKIVVDGI
jgi:hypothetical protein